MRLRAQRVPAHLRAIGIALGGGGPPGKRYAANGGLGAVCWAALGTAPAAAAQHIAAANHGPASTARACRACTRAAVNEARPVRLLRLRHSVHQPFDERICGRQLTAPSLQRRLLCLHGQLLGAHLPTQLCNGCRAGLQPAGQLSHKGLLQKGKPIGWPLPFWPRLRQHGLAGAAEIPSSSVGLLGIEWWWDMARACPGARKGCLHDCLKPPTLAATWRSTLSSCWRRSAAVCCSPVASCSASCRRLSATATSSCS